MLQIGDADGFGFSNPNATWQSAQNAAPDVDGDGIIEAGEFLPDIDNDGSVHVFGSDEFDHRSESEKASTTGAQWTDISLEDYYQDYGDSPANDVSFTFEFAVPLVSDDGYGRDHFINFIFGDYDVSPAKLFVDGVEVALTTQAGNQDGLVQLAYVAVAWEDMLDGQVIIDLYAPNEPYLAIDYALLSTQVGSAVRVSEPSAWLLLLMGLAVLRCCGRKSRLLKIG